MQFKVTVCIHKHDILVSDVLTFQGVTYEMAFECKWNLTFALKEENNNNKNNNDHESAGPYAISLGLTPWTSGIWEPIYVQQTRCSYYAKRDNSFEILREWKKKYNLNII